MRFSLITFILTTLATFCKADVDISSPSSSTSVTADSGEVSISIAWKDDGSSPDISEASTFTFKLCTGPNSDIVSVAVSSAVSASSLSGNKYSAKFDASKYSSGKFYIQVYTTFSTGGYSIHYSPRFKITGLTGSTAASGSGDSPDAQYSLPASSVNSASFSVPYVSQTGKTRYAPMQMQPGSTVTVTTWSRRFPSSAVTYYSTYKKSPVVLSTITPGWSYTMESLVNDATPAPFPSAVGWYPASKRLQSASLEGSARTIKKRRWDD
ncbi:KRE9 [Brettanomyces bruxellensis]|uniref:DEBR0S1_13586g1_1 n=1 Tax=Dekkera bruxellensis TaxID=5007 RepID=A0A7D9CV48_DEKBR|nr:uncharacterized protein BRETT_002510 [Brettanomyces bruxellensis]QOU22333.1 hypothetical protein BRETT_002510 [Brettanomyces bruxellensis]VUG16314.1 KRE9 [Brettanomyces bruxellensis]